MNAKHDPLTEQVADLVHAAKLGNFGMEWTRWNSANQAEHIIALVRADERKRIREALLSDEAVKAVLDSHLHKGSKFGQEEYWLDAREGLDEALAAIGLTEEQS